MPLDIVIETAGGSVVARPGRLGLVCRLLVCVACVAGFVTPLRAADPFYTKLLSAGTKAYDRSDYETALQELRIASFGFLNEPDRLARALTYLAMAQADSADFDGFTNTAHRIVEIENHFQAFTRANLPGDLRSRFTNVLTARLPEATLLDSPTFASLLQQRSRERFATLTPEQKRNELIRRLTDEPNSLDLLNALVELELAGGRTIEALNWLDRVVSVDPAAMEPRCQRSDLAAQVGDCRTALADRFHCSRPPTRLEPAAALVECMINQENWGGAAAFVKALSPVLQADPKLAKLAGRIRRKQRSSQPSERSTNATARLSAVPIESVASVDGSDNSDAIKSRSAGSSSYRDDLAILKQRLRQLSPRDDSVEVMILAQSISDRYLHSKDVQVLAGELAYRLSRWDLAIKFFDRAGKLTKKQPDLLFYFAVSLFETGQVDAARQSLREALPRLQRTPFVESFIARINLQNGSIH